MPWQLPKPDPQLAAPPACSHCSLGVTRVVSSRGAGDLATMARAHDRHRRCSLPPGLSWFRRGVQMALGVITVLILFSFPGSALAHVDIDVGDGRYVMEIGFRDEPAYLGQPNALYLSVEEYGTGGTEPVNDLAATLSAEVGKDGQVMDLPLVPTGDGTYEAAFVPTAAGDYTFRIFGTIGDAAVDESVTSGPSTFNSVEPLSAIEFPVARPDAVQLQAEFANLDAAVSTARTLAIAGVAAGVLGLVLGALAFVTVGSVEDRIGAASDRTVGKAHPMMSFP